MSTRMSLLGQQNGVDGDWAAQSETGVNVRRLAYDEGSATAMNTGLMEAGRAKMSLIKDGALMMVAKLERVEILDQLDVVFDTVVGLQQQTDGGHCGVGILRSGIVGQEKSWLEPAGIRWLGASLTGVRWLVCGIRDGCEGARMQRLVGGAGDVPVCEEGGCAGRVVNVDPHQQRLYKLHVQLLSQEKEATFGMVDERVCV